MQEVGVEDFVFAHRGASIEHPENTLAAFRRAMELGAAGVELDVHLSADGVPVVIHDDTVDRTTNGSGEVSTLTIDVLQQLDAGNGERIPTLGQVLDVVEGKLQVDIEVKAAEAAEAVLAEVRDRPTLAFAMSSFMHDVLRHVRTLDENVELWPLSVTVSDELIQTAKDLGSTQVAIFDGMVNQDIIGELGRHELRAWIWTVNDPQRALELMRMGAVGICTDDPAAIQRALGFADTPSVP